MDHVSAIITGFIRQNMEERGLSLYFTDDDKLLAMDDQFETHFKFDLVFSDNDFSCLILSRGDKGLEVRQRFNISWTSARSIREFMEYVRKL
ncbi:MAG: hypothetical protein ACOX5A_07045 [Aminivibrio sp.]|jgi:hypothetical protein|nr:hypothetical protein [Synergistaceae bacterium]